MERSNKRLWRVFRGLGFLISLVMMLSLALAVFLYGYHRNDIPNVLSVSDYRPSIRSKVFAQNGELIAEFGIHERIVVKKGEIPPLLEKAFISSEDKNFYHHHGIDFLGIINAVVQSVTQQRSSLRGASTITQQLAKSLLVKKEGYEQATARTVARKIKEAILARRLEMHLSKEDILWIYLNEVYLGHGSYGVAAAARNYFHKNLNALSLNEIAMIAGLPQAPSRFSPQVNRQAALSRQSYVLGRMREDGFIDEKQLQDALAANLHMKVYERENSFRKTAPFFSESIRRTLMEEFGEDTLYEDGLNIYTTLDIEHERTMQRVLKSGLVDIDKRQGFLGPLFSPKDQQEQILAQKTITSLNQENVTPGIYFASVNQIDEAHNAVVVDVGAHRGVIPLAGMFWARVRDPSVNYDLAKLRSVKDVLKPHDVILVRERTVEELQKLNEESSNKEALDPAIRFAHDKRMRLFSLEQEPSIEGAMISLEPSTGYVTALSGGYSFDRSEFNRVFQACRQPGSAFKPVVYAAAIVDKKYTPATLVLDAPLTFHDGVSESTWRPKNFGNSFKGEVTVREAVMNSMNIPTLNVTSDVGTGAVINWAKKFGVTSPLKHELGTGLGASCITPWELAHVYDVFANLGAAKDSIMIKEITDRDHKRIRFGAKSPDAWIRRNDLMSLALMDFFTMKNQVMEQEDAYTLHYLLTEATRSGTAQRASVLRRHLAGKTGTTNDSFDTWFAGYTKNLLSLVWIGNDTMDMPLGVYEQGGKTALPLFIDFMGTALKNLPDHDWMMPKSMCEARIDGKSGLRVEDEHPLSFVAPFRCGSEPPLLDAASIQTLDQAMELLHGT